MKAHPLVTSADLDRWLKKTEESIPFLLDEIRNGRNRKGERFDQLAMQYLTVANASYLKEAPGPVVLGSLRKSCITYLTLLQESARGADVKPGFVDFVPFEYMLIALVANDEETAKQIAQLFGTREPGRFDAPYHVHVGRSIKKALLDGSQPAIVELSQLSAKDVFKERKALTDLLMAVFKNDQEKLSELAAKALVEFDEYSKRELKGTPLCVLYLHCLGLLKLNLLLNKAKVVLPEDVRLPSELLYFVGNVDEKPEFAY